MPIFGWGVVELFLIGPLIVVVVAVVLFLVQFARRARGFGYESTSAYLRAVPRSDPEKRDAVDLLLKGLVISVLGTVHPFFFLAGLVPAFYGARKVTFAVLGLGLVDDGDQPYT